MSSPALLAALAAIALVTAGAPARAMPAAATAASAPAHSMPGAGKHRPPPAPVQRIDINSAGRKELKTLPGIGDAEAERIIANRPYLSKAELVNKKVLPLGPYISIKNRIAAVQKAAPRAPAAAKS